MTHPFTPDDVAFLKARLLFYNSELQQKIIK